MVKSFIPDQLKRSKLVEDSRDGLSGDQVKLVPTPPNHPSRKFRIIQLWDSESHAINAVPASERQKTALTPFIEQDLGASCRRRWPVRRPSPLKVDLVEEERKGAEQWQICLEKVRQHRAASQTWECERKDGLDPGVKETLEEYESRLRPLFSQKW
jgi:hypothetical protein